MHGADVLLRGWHSGQIRGCPTAATASSRLLGLSADDAESAIGIVCTQAGCLMAAQYEGMVKRVQHAFAARNGLFGSILAHKGYVGIKTIFERSYGGFLDLFSQGNDKTPRYDVREITRDLSSVWHTTRIRVKLCACVGDCHGQIEATERLQNSHPDRFTSSALRHIVSIKAGLPGPIFTHDGWEPHERPLSSTGAQMNAAYIGAAQFFFRQVLISEFSDDILNRDELWDLIYKTRCYNDSRFDKPNHACGARVVVAFDGVAVEETTQMPRGFDPPMTDEEIQFKYRKLATSLIDQQRAEKIEELVLGLDQLEDISELIRKLAKPTKRALG